MSPPVPPLQQRGDAGGLAGAASVSEASGGAEAGDPGARRSRATWSPAPTRASEATVRRYVAIAILLVGLNAAAESLEGVVVGAADKKPLAGVSVTFVGGPSATTAVDGTFH